MKENYKNFNRLLFFKIYLLRLPTLFFLLLSLIGVNAQNVKVNSNDKNSELNSKIILIDDVLNDSQKQTALDKTKILSLIKNTQRSLYFALESSNKILFNK